MPRKKKGKYDFLDTEYKESIIKSYNNGKGVGIIALARKYGVSFNVMLYRLKRWGVYNPRGWGHVQEKIKVFRKEVIRDRLSGMTLRYLEQKYGIGFQSLFDLFKELPKPIKVRKPDEEELERLLEDINSELFFLDELSHFYVLKEEVIIQIAHKHKCILHLGYDDSVDFLMYDKKLTWRKILKERKSL